MRVMPSKEVLEEAIKTGEEIKEMEIKMAERGYGISRFKMDDLDVYAGLSKKGFIRIMANNKPVGEYPCAERIAIWKDIKDKIN